MEIRIYLKQDFKLRFRLIGNHTLLIDLLYKEEVVTIENNVLELYELNVLQTLNKINIVMDFLCRYIEKEWNE